MLHYSAPLLRLPIRFDVDRLRRETDQFPHQLRSPDRLSAGIPGAYTTLALVTRHGRENDDMFGPFAPTRALAACPYVRRVIAWFEAPVCEVRLRWLGPRASGAFHYDRHRLLEDRYRVHIPIHTTPHAHFYCADRVVHMTAGSAWTFDRMRRHAVFNDDPAIGRLHLIMDFRPSEKLRQLVDRGSVDEVDVPLASIAETVEPRLELETERASAVWSPARLRTEMSALRSRFADDSQFETMAAETKELVRGWTAVWRDHRSARSGWPSYQRLARTYFTAWRQRFPISDAGDERSETASVACLLDTGAYVPAHARAKPSWSTKEVLRLVDALRITIRPDGSARVSVDGNRWRPIPPSAVTALLETARGASGTTLRRTLGKKRFDEASPTLRWLADEGALRVDDDAYQLHLFGHAEQTTAGDDLVVTPATMARLELLRTGLDRSSRFRIVAGELSFIIKPSGTVGAYLPHVEAYDMLFPDALAIAQHMALGLSVDEIAQATGYGATDEFLMFIAWLSDVLPLTCQGEGNRRTPTFVERLDRGEAITVPTLSTLDPVSAVSALAQTGPCTIILDTSGPCSPASIRRAVAVARIKHVDVLVKTSRRCGFADLHALPVAGVILADCDAAMLRDVAHAFGDEARPFVLAVIESMQALDELDAIASSPCVDALVVGIGDLARSARLSGLDPAVVVRRAETRVRSVAVRNGKRWAAVVDGTRGERRARARGAALILRGTDAAVLADGMRSFEMR